jgi:hypothetical protein
MSIVDMIPEDQRPEVVRMGVLDMQVCVPENWLDGQIKVFAEMKYECGTGAGWQIRTDPKLLDGCPSRNPCAKRPGFVHVVLDA